MQSNLPADAPGNRSATLHFASVRHNIDAASHRTGRDFFLSSFRSGTTLSLVL